MKYLIGLLILISSVYSQVEVYSKQTENGMTHYWSMKGLLPKRHLSFYVAEDRNTVAIFKNDNVLTHGINLSKSEVFDLLNFFTRVWNETEPEAFKSQSGPVYMFKETAIAVTHAEVKGRKYYYIIFHKDFLVNGAENEAFIIYDYEIVNVIDCLRELKKRAR